jgi:hypothetical protein
VSSESSGSLAGLVWGILAEHDDSDSDRNRTSPRTANPPDESLLALAIAVPPVTGELGGVTCPA